MADTIDVPQVGPVKKQYVLAAGGLVAGILVYAYWSRSRSAPAEEVAPEPEDPFEGSFGTNGGGDGTVSGYPDRSSDTTTNGPKTNAEWVELAMDKLTDSYEPSMISGALSRYLDRQPLSLLDQSIVRAALARAGYPPDGRLPMTPGGDALPPAAPSGLAASSLSPTTMSLRWSPVAGAVKYEVRQGGALAASAPGVATTISGLTANTSYTFTVAAVSAAGITGPASTVTGKTRAALTVYTPPPPRTASGAASAAAAARRK